MAIKRKSLLILRVERKNGCHNAGGKGGWEIIMIRVDIMKGKEGKMRPKRGKKKTYGMVYERNETWGMKM